MPVTKCRAPGRFRLDHFLVMSKLVSKLTGQKILVVNSGGKPPFLTCSILCCLNSYSLLPVWFDGTERLRIEQVRKGAWPAVFVFCLFVAESGCLPYAAVGVLNADEDDLFGETVVLFEVEGGDADGACWW